jgi:hypothetical protein
MDRIIACSAQFLFRLNFAHVLSTAYEVVLDSPVFVLFIFMNVLSRLLSSDANKFLAHSHFCCTQDRYTALIFAAKWGHHECVRLLVEGGANTEARDHVCAILHSLAFIM